MRRNASSRRGRPSQVGLDQADGAALETSQVPVPLKFRIGCKICRSATTKRVMSNSRAQDQASLERLLGQAVWLQRCAKRMGYRTEAAEDAVQETFLQASQSEPRTLGIGWLRRTLQRQLGMQLRSEHRRSHRERETAKPEALDLDPARPLEELEFQRDLHRAVAQLPRRDREVLALRFVADLSVQEIAKSLGQSPNAVSSRLSRALKRLRSAPELDESPGASDGRLAWLPIPMVNLLRQTPSSLMAAGSFLPFPFFAFLAVAMKKTLFALVILTLVALGSLALFERSPGEPSLERHGADARNRSSASLRELNSERQLILPAETATSDGRVTFTGEDESPAPEQGVDPAPPGLGRVRVLCLETASATPVAGMAIELIFKSRGALGFGRTVVCRTNERGEAHFSEVEPGTVRAMLTRFGDSSGRYYATVEVLANETAEMQLEVDPQQEAWGIVVDEAGQPVAGAELWIGHRPGSVEKGYLVGKSGGNGDFALKYMGTNQFVCARAKGYAPSLSSSPGFTQDYAANGLRLVLVARRGTLHGAVRSPAGELLQDVLVRVGEMTTSAPGPGFNWTTIPQWRKTDEVGRFEFHDLGIGEVSVRARAPQSTPWEGSVSITDGGTAELVIQLRVGGILVGQVRTEQGDPAPAARIRAFSGEGDRLAQVETRADQEGRFRLPCVDVGEMILEAESEDQSTKHRETLFIHDGAERVWSPVLSSAHKVAGFVVSETGVPLKGWYVSARPLLDGIDGRNSSGAYVLSDGSFSIQPKRADAYALRVFPPGRYIGPEAFLLESLDPRADAPTLIVPTDRIPTASVRGQLVTDAGDALVGRVRLTVSSTPTTNIEQTTSPEGRFQFSYLPEGSFTLTLQAAGLESREVPSAGNLVRDEERDLGPLTLSKR